MLLRRIVLVLFALLSSRLAVAEPALVRWTAQPITIDGSLDEDAWSRAEVITNFTQHWKQPPGMPKAATKARLLWDREYIYFSAEMQDRDLFADVTQHDGAAWNNDVFELFFKPSTNLEAYYEFEINPLNTVFDVVFFSKEDWTSGKGQANQDFHLKTAVKLKGTIDNRKDHDTGWTVEGRIPWTDFLATVGRPEPGDEWNFNLCRIDYNLGAEAELSATSPLQKPSFHLTSDYLPLRFEGPDVPPAPVWATSKLSGSPNPPALFKTERAYTNVSGHFFVGVATEPGSDRVLYLEQTDQWGGKTLVKRIHANGPPTEPELALDFPDKAYSIAFHPGFSTNGFIYFGANGPQDRAPKYSRITRYTVGRQAPWQIDPASRLLIIEWLSDGHNGAGVCFGNDGMMYVTSGDGTADSDANVAGQDLTKLTSKVLRLDVDHPANGLAYSIPKDNPFVGREGARPETWMYGCRNPWRITSDPVSGQIWVGENGQDLYEYAYLTRKGANMGWSVFEGSHPFLSTRKLGPEPHQIPDLEHPHSEFRSLTGGVVYRGKKHPSLVGAYVYGDYSTGRIWAALHDGSKLLWDRELTDTTHSITGFGTDPDGEILVVDHIGTLNRLVANVGAPAASSFPRKLSETGLFKSLGTLAPAAGVVPYEINEPHWTDGAHSAHWVALTNGARAEVTTSKGWNLPDSSVLVQHLEIATNSLHPEVRTRLETRVLLKQENEWAGYTFVWNEAGTEALLAPAEGEDRQLVILDPKAGVDPRNQYWRVPSRAECMICHSRAANYVLGFGTTQLNHRITTNRGSVNQLTLLEAAGVLKVDFPGYSAWNSGRTGQPLKFTPAPAASSTPPSRLSNLLPLDPDRMVRQPGIGEVAEPVDARVRSFLAANCSHCHVPTGGGNAAMDLDYFTPLANTGLVGAKSQHWAFDIENPKIIWPGAPEKSVLYRRISQRDEAPMPPIAVSTTHQAAASLVKQWIEALKGADGN